MISMTLTRQTYKRRRSPKIGQIILLEDFFDLSVEEGRVTLLILQLHLDVAPELVILGEYRYHGNYEK